MAAMRGKVSGREGDETDRRRQIPAYAGTDRRTGRRSVAVGVAPILAEDVGEDFVEYCAEWVGGGRPE